MTYDELRNFQGIFGRNDFLYIYELSHIEGISEIILTNLVNPDGNENNHIVKISLFIGNLNSFFNWLNGRAIADMAESRKICEEILSKVIALFRESGNKRIAISRGYLRKFNKIFLYGLSLLVKGIRAAFNPDLVSATNIDRDQLERFIIDKKEGLGNRYLFNTTGNHAFTKKLEYLSKVELIVTERLLLNPKKARRFRGWIDFGGGRRTLRILVKPRTLLKDEVYFLFRGSEHREYQQQLKNSPTEFQFSAA